MAYFDHFNKDVWHELGMSYDMFRPYALTESDIERSTIIADEIIDKYEKRVITPCKEMTFGNVLQSAATVYYNLGMHTNARKAVSILSKVQYQDNNSLRVEDLTVQSMMVRTGAMISKQPYYVEVPKKFNTSSVHFMAHEIAHMLKESNPYECKGIYTDLEVIPILIEMISAHVKGDNNVFRLRELLMLDIAYSFKKLQEDLDNNRISKDDMIAFNACYRQNILYLNSFYYSLRLFSMYLDAPKYVLGIIDDVLSHRLTTRDVINNYLSNDDYTYESGMDQFRRRLK